MRRRIILVLVALALLLVPVACGGSEKRADSGPGDTAATATTEAPPPGWVTEVATAVVPQVQVYKDRPADTTGTTDSSAVAGTGISLPNGADRPAIPRDGYASAGVATTPTGYVYDNPTYFKNPLVFMVTQDDGGDWLQVDLLARPNHQQGWIRRSDVTTTTHDFHLKLTKSTFTLQAFQGDTLLGQTQVVIGRDQTYTPVGTFFITEKIARPPAGVYGPWILATSGYSESLDDFDGGLPQVALHGTNNPALIGTKASNGCVRMANDFISKLAYTIPAGTPLVIED